MGWNDYGITDISGGSGGPARASRNWTKILGMDKGSFLILLIIIVVVFLVLTTGSILILHNVWDLLMRLSTTIPLWLGAVLLIFLFVVLRKPKKTYYR
jgi:ABC-type xylose transport system permease subunit